MQIMQEQLSASKLCFFAQFCLAYKDVGKEREQDAVALPLSANPNF